MHPQAAEKKKTFPPNFTNNFCFISIRDGEIDSIWEQRNVVCGLLKFPRPKSPAAVSEIVNQDTYYYETTVSVAFRDYFMCPAQLWYSLWLGMWRHSKCMSTSVNFAALVLVPLINLIFTVK